PITIIKNKNIHKDGYIVTLETSGVPFFDDNGALMGYRGIDRDITEKLEAERKLKESEQLNRSLIEGLSQTGIGIAIIDYNFNIIYQSQYLKEQFGEHQKRNCFEFYLGREKSCEDCQMMKAIQNNKIEKAIITAPNNRTYEVIAAPIPNPSGKIERAAEVIIDITARIESEQKIKESEIQFRDLYEEAPTAYLSIGHDKSLIRCNSAAEKLLGYTKEELLKMKVFDLYADTENGIGAAKITFKKFLKGESIKDVELQMKNKDGNPVWISLYVRPIFDQEGNVIESRSMILDITERRKAEEALKESEEKFRTITEQSFLGIAIQQDNIIKYVNNQLAQTFGYTVEEIMNWEVGGFLNVIHLEDREMVAKQARKKQLGESDSIDQYQFRGIKKNGDIIWLEIYSKSINYNGKQANFVMIHDITTGKIFKQKSLESEEKFRNIFETIPDLFFLVSGDTTILDYKGNLEELYLPPEEFLGKKLSTLIPENVAVLSLNSIAKTLETHEPQIIEYNLDMNGENRFYEARHLYFTEDKVLIFVRDITERKKTQENLLISEKKFKESYDRANFYKDLFAHDMSNILQVINSSAELILFQLGDSEKSRNIANIATIIKKQIERGAKLISNVRTLSELKDGEVITKRVEINKFIKNAITFVKKAYERRNIKISFESVSKKHYTNANELLQDVFENVLINGIKYNENSTIEISIKISKQEVDAKDYIKIEFIDNGIGVSDERKEVIFLSGNRELKGSKGMGLGLSLVSKILNIFKGEIQVEDKIKGDYTKGSNFIILLPEEK
ncbi:MAG: PAS domain S-box protein, partial [Candidatus Lokiarchaeota archaeon]|nr:PAS domain S-box protein [Candidatus Lokiarchaeota archaeon]